MHHSGDRFRTGHRGCHRVQCRHGTWQAAHHALFPRPSLLAYGREHRALAIRLSCHDPLASRVARSSLLRVGAVSGGRYRDTANLLHIPLVAAALVVPMALSGLLVEQMGFAGYFLLNALTAPFCLVGIYLLRRREIPLTI